MDRYLVELSRPDAGWEDVQALAARARSAAAELTGQGVDVRFLRAIYLPEDGTCALLFEGASAESVREAGRRAGGDVERLTPSEVVSSTRDAGDGTASCRRFIARDQGDRQIMLENARTGEHARVDGLAAIGEQIGRWLDDPGDRPVGADTAPRSQIEASS